MKILIIHASAGQGHQRAAQAIYDSLRQNSSHAVTIIDSLEFTNPLFKFFYIQGYSFLISHFTSVWGFFYYLTDRPKNRLFNSFLRSLNNNLNSLSLRKFLKKENFDLIISTHFFANDVISALKKENFISAGLFCVVTDYLVHYYWISEGVDKYLVACGQTKDCLIKLGVDERKIGILGIPVGAGFFEKIDKNSICQKLNLGSGKFRVLVATGAFGFTSIDRIVDLLGDKDIQLLVVCGNNKKLFQKLSVKAGINLKVFGFVGNMDELMAAADVIVTKPGGLTITEALIKNLPMIFVAAIPGQETNNAAFFEEQGLGITAKNMSQLKEIICRFKLDRDYLLQFKLHLERFPKANAAKEILKYIS